ncbi:hydantoin utilization protein B [Pseudooceanicola batsensis HTCC2597]|uniref:Hydantoin utilization protein B n=1 Tax=Pseudooceanicola batsensis (strain ATCC BAA-863 / DSM 15984 / KCTC 12145 / HTCC2597) TaxID=252305 RepID=A3U1I0_PSEBH|nr:hydantoinase B/oxoprolinase family protein [Pseudooceanicola batsensis]EAQ02163.1 hydantoin utilization protein B [Pseudooceanicola batsensis HTCC2597]
MQSAFTEIMRNRFTAIAEEASTMAYRTAHTTFVKQTQDFQVALARTDGAFFAFPTMTGVTSSVAQDISPFTRAIDEPFEPGDVIITNDPHRTVGLVTHTMDIHMAQPIFYKGELICFAWSFVHATDIGGAVPGSISPDLYEVYQEGIQIRPVKLRRKGVQNDDIVNLLKDNSRIGEEVWGDLEAMQSAMRLLERRVDEICDKIGPERFRTATDALLDYAETKARSVIANLKDGTYRFSDYLEAGSADDAVHIHCKLTIRGDEAEIDYSGSDPQVASALNFATGERTHPFLCTALTNYINTMEPSTPVNGGIIRPIRAYAPRGTIMNAEFPAAMGNRWVAVMRTYDALMGCLNQAIDGAITAGGAGQAGIISVSWPEEATGRTRVSVVEPFSGGSGGRRNMDGVHGNDTMVGYLKSTPVESVEVDCPLVVRRHELVPESFGHGKFRGGAAVRIELEARAPQCRIAVRGLDRLRFQPWGVQGGAPGTAGKLSVRKEGSDAVIRQINILALARGDTLTMTSPGGGGFGPPLERAPEHVLKDVRDGFLGPDTARRHYGVAISNGQLDLEETKVLRARMMEETGPPSLFAFGVERENYQATIDPDIAAVAAKLVLREPQGRRPALIRQIRGLQRNGELPVDPAEAETWLLRTIAFAHPAAEAG